MNIGITGGTGFVGGALTKLLTSAGHTVTIFTRKPKVGKPQTGVTYAAWDIKKGSMDAPALSKLDACVHLAGAGIADERWTDARKQEIVNSRVQGTELVVKSLKAHAPACKTLISASATGWYGEDPAPAGGFRETDTPAQDFLGETCVKWEAAAAPAADFLRLVIPRFGIVFGKGGGAFEQFSKGLTFRTKPVLGSGGQVMSWIHRDDLIRLIHHMLESKTHSGVYNAVAPHPASNAAIMDALAEAHGGFHLQIPVPAAALKLALGEMSTEVLKSCTVSAAKTEGTGFQYKYSNIREAAKELMS